MGKSLRELNKAWTKQKVIARQPCKYTSEGKKEGGKGEGKRLVYKMLPKTLILEANSTKGKFSTVLFIIK